MRPTRDDRIFRSTRMISAVIIPFLLLAFVTLYFFPQFSGQRFAWRIQPKVMALYIGAGYLGGAYLFLHASLGRHWHRVAAAFPAVAAFTLSMLAATVLHWNRFDLRHSPFQLWLALYAVTPVLVPWMWLRNRVTDPGTLEADDVVVPRPVRVAVRLLGFGLAAAAVAGFAVPPLLLAVWPWQLTQLSARVLAGWGALLGVGSLIVAGDRRWSAWRVGVESIALWHLLLLAGAIPRRGDFTNGGLLNWYVLSVAAVLILTAAFYAVMEAQRRQKTALLRQTA